MMQMYYVETVDEETGYCSAGFLCDNCYKEWARSV